MTLPTDGHDPGEPLSRDDLVRPLVEACVSPHRFRVGIEAERIGVHDSTWAPVTYDGVQGILRIFRDLTERFGWHAVREGSHGPVIALRRGDAAITLEPACQLELSSSPMHDLHALRAEYELHLEEVRAVSDPLGIQWMGIGFHPFARDDQLGWVPKARYAVMREYLPTRGARALDMMRRTATVQANFDFESEQDAVRKLRIALRLSPIVSAMFAHAPLVESRAFGGRSFRLQVWLDVDPARQGLLPQMWREGASFADYVEWALDAPMFLIHRGGRVVRNTGQPFRAFLRDGFHSFRATRDDWALHLGTLFPDVRLRRTLEVRAADSVPPRLVLALPALWTGLLYDPVALSTIEQWSADWSYAQVESLRRAVGRLGFGAQMRGESLRSMAEFVVETARSGLQRRARTDPVGRDESAYLRPLERLVERGLTPADDLLATLDFDRAIEPQVLEHCQT